MILNHLIISGILPVSGQSYNYLNCQPEQGDGAITLLKRYGIAGGDRNTNAFLKLNSLNRNDILMLGKSYRVPIRIYSYNGKSIRSTIGNDDWDMAVRIRDYNDGMHKAGIKPGDYRKDRVLWVPEEILDGHAGEIETAASVLKFPIFGSRYEDTEIISNRLNGDVFYVVAGHGGPDPGAMGKYRGHFLCEDEYAYDIALRLARNLLSHSATVYLIIRDDNDGIRNGEVLAPDKDERCWVDEEIPINQMKRLSQRAGAINDLYLKHKKEGVRDQTAIFLHLDSRSSKERIDMFFYHSPKSKSGRKLATTLRNTIEAKYNYHQKNRGYSGTVVPRNLYVLRKTYPVAVFIELGNIRNSADQRRFVIEDNRQAVANWLSEGLMKHK